MIMRINCPNYLPSSNLEKLKKFISLRLIFEDFEKKFTELQLFIILKQKI